MDTSMPAEDGRKSLKKQDEVRGWWSKVGRSRETSSPPACKRKTCYSFQSEDPFFVLGQTIH